MAKSIKEAVDFISEETGVSKAKVKAVYLCLMKNIADDLAHGERSVLSGIGSFNKKRRAARKGRNPATGEEVAIPEKNIVKFTASSLLLDNIN